VKTNTCHKEVLEAINSNLGCHNVTVLGFHHKEDIFIAGVEALSDVCNNFTEVRDSSLVSA